MMKIFKRYTCVIFLIFYSNCFFAQDKKEEDKKPKGKAVVAAKPKKQMVPYSKLSLKTGLNLSVIYLARNTKDRNNEPGFSFGALYEVNSFVRVSCLYTRFRTLDIDPTWKDIKASTYEANLEIIAKFPDKKTYLYPFAGFSFNTYKGYFTGQDDYLDLKNYYGVNTVVSNYWLGMNFGLGFEHNFGPFGLYLDYRMRVGKQENGINIMDVCYSAGVKCLIPKLKVNGKKIFRNPNDKLHWF